MRLSENIIKNYLPNIIFIGPDKSGSTWLYFIFEQHKDVFVPKIKDIYFFDKNFDKGVSWYIQFFKAKKDEKFICDISHDYLFSKKAARRIEEIYLRYKKNNLILLSNLRNPVDKLWSHYLFLRRSGITKLPLDLAIQKFPELLHKSLYYTHVKRYKSIFGSKYKIFLFEDLKKNPEFFAMKLFKELGLTFDPSINFNIQILPAAQPRSFYLAKFAKKVAKFLRETGNLEILGILKRNSVINKILYKPFDKKPEIPIDFAKKLWNFYFKEDVEKLSDLLGIDLINLWGRDYEL